jgi:hypothetical protein
MDMSTELIVHIDSPAGLMNTADLSSALGILDAGLKRVAEIKAELREEVRKRLEAGDSVAGYEMREVRPSPEVLDIGGLSDALEMECGITKSEFVSCCAVSLPKLKKSFADRMKAAGKMSKKAAMEDVTASLDASPFVLQAKPRLDLHKI